MDIISRIEKVETVAELVKLSAEIQDSAAQARFLSRLVELQRNVGGSPLFAREVEADGERLYALGSFSTHIRDNGEAFVVCEPNHAERVGQLVVVVGHQFLRRDKSFQVVPLDRIVKGVNGRPDAETNLKWAVGGWAMLLESNVGTRKYTEVYSGLIGENSENGRNLNVTVEPTAVFNGDFIRGIVSDVMRQTWGASSLPMVADGASLTQTLETVRKLNRFGVQVAGGTSKRRVLHGNTVVALKMEGGDAAAAEGGTASRVQQLRNQRTSAMAAAAAAAANRGR